MRRRIDTIVISFVSDATNRKESAEILQAARWQNGKRDARLLCHFVFELAHRVDDDVDGWLRRHLIEHFQVNGGRLHDRRDCMTNRRVIGNDLCDRLIVHR